VEIVSLCVVSLSQRTERMIPSVELETLSSTNIGVHIAGALVGRLGELAHWHSGESIICIVQVRGCTVQLDLRKVILVAFAVGECIVP
jgi:hypothetical protein